MKEPVYKELLELFKQASINSERELKRLSNIVDDVIRNNIRNEKIISEIFDSILSLEFVDEKNKSKIFYKLSSYCRTFDSSLADDYDKIFEEFMDEDELSLWGIMNIEKYGKIVCAALIYNNCIYMSYKGHYDIFTMEEIGVLRTAPQGFVTENGYFVDRDLGLLIAKHYNQIEYKYNPQDKLLSEDLNKENLKVLKRINKYSYKEK